MKYTLLSFCACAVLASCASYQTPINSAMASGRTVSKPVQCVPYARDVSGIQIRGDAHTWWDSAAGRYSRGNVPAPGAVMVLARTGKMAHGHLAVVKSVLGRRDITVTHSNWGDDRRSRSIIYDSMRVQDVSAANDWSSVRFWNPELGVFGFPYRAQGFIYVN